jgi:hypothetical protein
MPRVEGDLVDVRASASLAWLQGTVRSVQQGSAQDCYGVELDTPVTSDTWSGVTRRYGGSTLVGTAARMIYVHEHVEKLAPDELIRNQGG